jgi:hypothetical protein
MLRGRPWRGGLDRGLVLKSGHAIWPPRAQERVRGKHGGLHGG